MNITYYIYIYICNHGVHFITIERIKHYYFDGSETQQLSPNVATNSARIWTVPEYGQCPNTDTLGISDTINTTQKW